jgi:microcystin-dependent protein
MPNALTDTNISTTYAGVLHAQGEPIPATGLKAVYDGVGNKSSLSVGRDGNGIKVTGTIEADAIAVGGGGLDVSSVQAIVDLIYPVGALLITTNSTAPSYPGTTWEAEAEGKFIAGVGTGTDSNNESIAIVEGDDSNQNNQGEYNVTLDESQMPRHTHKTIVDHKDNLGVVKPTPHQRVGSQNNADHAIELTSSPAGGDQPHTNIPPWFGAYVWKRTS